MRKITEQAICAFMNNYNFKSGNTQVKQYERISKMYLHGYIIAIKSPNILQVRTAGWQTSTIKERLNGIPGVNIVQKNYQWYLNGKEWDGTLQAI